MPEHPELNGIDLSYLRGNSFFSERCRLLYVATPKAACTAMKWWFADLEGVDLSKIDSRRSGETDPSLVIHELFPRAAPGVAGIPEDALRKALGDRTIFKFALSRNPFTRLFSSWQSKVLLQVPMQMRGLLGEGFSPLVPARADEISLSFERFVEHLFRHQHPHFQDHHWRTQASILQADRIQYDRIERIETPTSPFASVVEHVRLQGVAPPHHRRINEGLLGFSRRFMTERSASMIVEMYSEDFRQFGYDDVVPDGGPGLSDADLRSFLGLIPALIGRNSRIGELYGALCEADEQLRLRETSSSARIESVSIDAASALAREQSALADGSRVQAALDAALAREQSALADGSRAQAALDAALAREQSALEGSQVRADLREAVSVAIAQTRRALATIAASHWAIRVGMISCALNWSRVVRRSQYFDADWYLRQYPDVARSRFGAAFHYARFGWLEGRDPGPAFDSLYYMSNNLDTIAAGLPALVHYERFGKLHGRAVTNVLELGPPVVPSQLDDILDRTGAIQMSVVMSTFNRAKLLPGVFESWRRVAAHTRLRWELIVTDDGSTDGTPEFVESIEGLPVRLVRNQHGGAGAARNAGIANASGQRILIVGDDIFPSPDLLDRHWTMGEALGPKVATLGSVDWHPDLAVNHLMLHVTEIGNEQFSYNRLEDGRQTDFRHFYTCNICIPSEWLRRTRPLFDLDFVGAAFEDTELGYRLAKAGMRLVFDRQANATHYHPYDAAGFCRRQVFAGKMATIFARKHPEVRWLIIPDRRRIGGSNRSVDWQVRLDDLLRLAEVAEISVSATRPTQSIPIRTALSKLYLKLFRAMYERGVSEGLGRSDALAEAMGFHFGSVGSGSWDLLRTRLGATAGGRCFEAGEIHGILNSVVTDRVEPNKLLRRLDPRVLALVAELRSDPAGFAKRFPTRLRRLVRRSASRTDRVIRRAFPFRSAVAHASASVGLVVDTESADGPRIISEFRKIFGPSIRVLSPGDLQQATAGLTAVGDIPPVIFRPASVRSVNCPDRVVSLFLVAAQCGEGSFVTSDSLDEVRCVVGGPLEDVQVFTRDAVSGALGAETSPAIRFIRFPTKTPPEEQRNVDSAQYLSASGSPSFGRSVAGWPSLFPPSGKPLVLVLPAMMAVGGVERNTIEIIRALSERFDFLIVTTERVSARQGSLAQQAREASARVIEIGEIAPPSMHLEMLAEVKRSLCPSIVWICNGSPWISSHSRALRELFFDTPILDQRAYDDQAGWISDYADPDGRLFDGYVAVNSRIERRMLKDFGIPRSNVRRIYSAVNSAAIRKGIGEWNSGRAREALGLPASGHVFSFVGRLSAQKQPLRFLELAARRKSIADETFVLVGDGEFASESEEFIARHQLVNVRRIPYIADTMCLHAASSGIVFVSAYEGLPIAMIEAICMAVPCLSTDVGEIGAVLSKFGGGITIPVGASIEDLDNAFGKWKEQLPAFRNALLISRDEVLRQFSAEHVAAQFEAFWRDLLLSRSGSQA